MLRFKEHIPRRLSKISVAADYCDNYRPNPAAIERIRLDHQHRTRVAGLGSALCANMTETSCVTAISEQGGKENQYGNDERFCPARCGCDGSI